mgnify:CR=1 FL=1
MLIGCGRHAKRNHLPVLFAMQDTWKQLVIVDLKENIEEIRSHIVTAYGTVDQKVVYVGIDTSVEHFPANGYDLPLGAKTVLNQALAAYNVDKVIISTDPEYHVAYACWALTEAKNVLMDKPISAPANLRTDPQAVARIYADYQYIYDALVSARKTNPGLVCNILAQRRYHVGFQEVLRLIEEISNDYGVGVTAFQSLHSDGQWRPPLEIISQDYHGYNRGYGKGMHSGYHAIDIVNYLTEKSLSGRNLDTSVQSNFVYPDDYLAAFPAKRQYEIFGYSLDPKQESLIDRELTSTNSLSYGEISGHLTLNYKNEQGKKVASGVISILHDGVSQRDWAEASGKDLYKNGRTRHESHYFVSGPLQAIKIMAYESDDRKQAAGIGIGEAYNFDIHVFRNSGIIKDSPAYRYISIERLYRDKGLKLQDPLKDSRAFGIHEFFECVAQKKISTLSDYTSHIGTMKLLTAMYESALSS